ncbi:DNA-binding transcriptional regulator, AcrR family [Actinomyces ruminicola]|uniref:DNA-binding transcriptional regulator, AcrR family n=1 Tax=Actinomyces ruminicola TaxID=332524 RepID=A0A1H0BLQ8_9ACTO|nr:TetR/AcrR family transcriptional regulator [Actinomyces ruminicola]SDN46617.1 DNA-binding transcriptional regulator, AcrR family [Actinomyces ruminicola]
MTDSDTEAVQLRRRRGTYATGRATQVKIIKAAVALFGESGFNASSLRDIAKRAGVTHSTLLHHFPTKAELLRAVLESRDQGDSILLADKAREGIPFLSALVTLMEHNATQRPLIELYATLSAEATAVTHPAHDYFVDRYEMVIEQNRRAFAQIKAEGLLRGGCDVERIARNTAALQDGLQIQWLLDSRVDMAACLREFLDGVLVKPLSELERCRPDDTAYITPSHQRL